MEKLIEKEKECLKIEQTLRHEIEIKKEMIEKSDDEERMKKIEIDKRRKVEREL